MLVKEIAALITKKTIVMRQPIETEIKIAITLRFLVCKKIYETFKGRFLRLPDTTEEWEIIEHETRCLWQFPKCIGVADGKHIAIIHPSNSGSEFYNYKGFFSIVLLAIVDYNYKFIFADVGCQGRISDGGVNRNSFFYWATQENLLELLPDKPLSVSNDPYNDSRNTEPMPYVFLADDTFSLGKHCLKPYSQSDLTPIKRFLIIVCQECAELLKMLLEFWQIAFAFLQRECVWIPTKPRSLPWQL